MLEVKYITPLSYAYACNKLGCSSLFDQVFADSVFLAEPKVACARSLIIATKSLAFSLTFAVILIVLRTSTSKKVDFSVICQS